MTDGVIGSVGVSVVPDAQDFWRRFRAQTEGGAGEAGRQAGQDWRRGFDESSSASVRIRADTSGLAASIGAVRSQLGSVGDLNVGTGTSSAQLASIAAATNRLTDTQERLRLARATLASETAREGVTEEELAAASAKVTRAQRDETLAALRLAAAQEAVAHANERASAASAKASAASEAAAKKAAAEAEKNKSNGFSGLINSAITLSPALIPIAGAAATAGVELAAMGAAGILAFKGIEAEMKAGTTVGVQYTGLVKLLKSNLGELEATASHGVLDGVQTSVGKLQQSMPQLNDVIATQSRLLGSVTSHLVGGLVGGFTTFAPVLQQIGESADRVAARFEGWATGPGGAKFAHVLSDDYAKVAPVIGDIVGAVGHLVAASNGTGLLIVSEIGVLARVLDSFPTPVLTGIVDAFIGFRVVSGITAAVSGLSNAFPILATRAAAAAAAQTAANLDVQASEAATAAATAIAQADRATAHAAATARIAESAAAQNSVLAESAAATALAAGEEATAFQLAATEAQAAAVRIAAAAEAAAATSAEAGAAASVGWSGMLGPIGIAVAAVGALSLGFLSSGSDAKSAAVDIQTLTQAIESDANAIGTHTRASVVDALGKSGALAAARQLHLSLSEVTDAALGTGTAYDTLKTKLEAQKQANADAYHAGKISGDELDRRYTQIQKVEDALTGENQTVKSAVQAAKDHAAALAATKQAEAGLAGSVLASTQQLSDGNTAIRGYVDALATFNKSADTAADRGKLIGSVLAAANGDALSFVSSMQQAAGADSALGDAFEADRQRISDLRDQIAQLTNVTGPSSTATGVMAAQINKTGTTIATTKDRIAQLQAQIASGTLSASGLASAHRALDNAQASLQVSSANLANQQSKLNTAQSGGTVNLVQLAKLQRELAAALKDTELGAIKFTGAGNKMSATIDYTAKGAGPLISQLQGIQTSSENAAAAVYQHEVATKGGKQAAADAYNFYVSHTAGALDAEAKKLGLTKDQAKALGDEYFGIKNSGDIKKKIELIGEDKVVAALQGILTDLDILIGKTTVLDLAISKANAHAPKNIGSSGDVLHQAAGGFITGRGSATSDSIPARLSNGEFVINAAQTSRHRRLLEDLNNGVKGFAAGGFAGHGDRINGSGDGVTVNQVINNPVKEPASVSGPAGVRRAALSLGR